MMLASNEYDILDYVWTNQSVQDVETAVLFLNKLSNWNLFGNFKNKMQLTHLCHIQDATEVKCPHYGTNKGLS